MNFFEVKKKLESQSIILGKSIADIVSVNCQMPVITRSGDNKFNILVKHSVIVL
jgi:hypothetical protein